MGAVLTPSLIGVDEAGHLPNASSFCGRCEEVCPVRIPLPKMMRHWREREFSKGNPPARLRFGLKGWALLARMPWLYRQVMSVAVHTLKGWSHGTGVLQKAPMAEGWTAHRELPAPEGSTFQAQWKAHTARNRDTGE